MRVLLAQFYPPVIGGEERHVLIFAGSRTRGARKIPLRQHARSSAKRARCQIG
jgi:hypothetical protein